jgi:hypothetical protein
MGRKHLEVAKQRLSELDFVGLTSQFEKSMEVMSWKLGLYEKNVKSGGGGNDELISSFCSDNINPFKSKHKLLLDKEAQDEVMKDNALDFELYLYAKALFSKEVAAYELAVPSTSRAPFVCNKNAMQCKLPRKEKWLPVNEYWRYYGEWVQTGEASNCGYSCELLDLT